MASYVAGHTSVGKPKFTGHVWRSPGGEVNATVSLGQYGEIWFAFDDPAVARALAAACTQAAEAIERFDEQDMEGEHIVHHVRDPKGDEAAHG
jgi:hypothetical protein